MAISTEDLRGLSQMRAPIGTSAAILAGIATELLAARAKLEAAEKLAEAAWEHDEAFSVLEDSFQIAAREKLEAALAAWEAAQ